MKLGIVCGLEAEARIARLLSPAAIVGISGATAEGARRATAGLIADGVTHLLSFGLAAGLDPVLRPGDLLLPDAVIVGGTRYGTDGPLRSSLTAGDGSRAGGCLLHSDALVWDCREKDALLRISGCASLDMESGFVAQGAAAAGLPFAVLRAVCDPAERSLPHAARVALQPDGRLKALGIAGAILRHPGELPALMALARDAARAKKRLHRHVKLLAARQNVRAPLNAVMERKL